jgi:hypothetical protein
MLQRSDGGAMACEAGKASSDLGRDQFAFSLLCGYQFAASRSCNGGERFATQAKVADDDVVIP